MNEWKLESLTVKPTEPAIAQERLISSEHCVNCGHLYYDHLVGMNTVQTGECRLCVCHQPETASKERVWEEHADLKAELASQREFLKYVAGQSKEALAIIQREGFVFDHSGGRWEKLAFTLYSDLVAISTDARHRLEEIEENNDEQ
jgi:hypothetical protein